MELNRFRKQFAAIEDACTLAQAIVTVREPVRSARKTVSVMGATFSAKAQVA